MELNILKILEVAFNLGIEITEIRLLPEQIKELFPDIKAGWILETFDTPFGEIKILCK